MGRNWKKIFKELDEKYGNKKVKRISESGCCGNPAKCAFDISRGRCKPREQFEERLKREKRRLIGRGRTLTR